MERIISDDERLRRAEEIYYRRNNRNINMSGLKKEKANHNRISKFCLELLVILNIAIVVVSVQNKDYIFTKEFLSKCSEYHMNFNNRINSVLGAFLIEDTNIDVYEPESNIVPNESESVQENEENITNTESESILPLTGEQSNGASNEQGMSTLTQMNLDIQNLKASYHFIKPINGVVSSGFGARESKYQNVTGYHTGTDIAAEKGTRIKASMEGIVTLVSSEGDYRKSCKN